MKVVRIVGRWRLAIGHSTVRGVEVLPLFSSSVSVKGSVITDRV